MELRHLRYFVCVAEEGNVSRAAVRLHISQPPLTRQIRQLEGEVGARLFTRTPKGVDLTDAGAVFLAEARQVLAQADLAAARALRAAQGDVGRIDVALFGTAVFGAIPMLLRAHRQAHPEVEFVLHNMTKHEQLDALLQGRIRLAFNRLMRPERGVVSEVLLAEPLLVATPDDGPLADRPALRLRDLDAQPMVLFPTGYRPSFIDRVVDMCRDAGAFPRVVAEVADVVHGIAMVASTGVSCLVPSSATNLHVPGVTYRPLLDTPRPVVDLCCIYRKGDDSPLLTTLLRSMRATAPHIVAAQRRGLP